MELVDTDTPSGDTIALHARAVKFDFSAVPTHYVYGDPVATHVYNALSLLLPAGEDWFVATLKEALPLITDDKLREDVIGFIGQESMHANAHAGIEQFLTDKGIDTGRMVDQANWIFGIFLGPRDISGPKAHNYLVERLAIIAAAEHVFSSLGDWILNAKGFNATTADPVIVDLMRWHGAEEVEHRMVSHDVLRYFDSGYLRRVRAQAVLGPTLLFLLWQCTRYLMKQDPELTLSARERKIIWRRVFASGRRGVLPTVWQIVRRMAQYFSPRFHPGDVGDTAQAVAYLAASPAARAALR